MTAATLLLERRGPFLPSSDLKAAHRAWAAVRVEYGLTGDGAITLLTAPENQHKVRRNVAPAWSLALTAGREAGMCVNSTACLDVCVVDKGGNARFDIVKAARAARTAFLLSDPEAFAALLRRDVLRMAAKGALNGRLNANSDVAWERVFPWLFELVDEVGGYAYDYTKRIDRAGWVRDNYRVAYSVVGVTRPSTVARLTGRGDTVAAIFPTRHALPVTWLGIPVIDGDTSDDRFIDPAGVVVGLRWKAGLINKPGHPALAGAEPTAERSAA